MPVLLRPLVAAVALLVMAPAVLPRVSAQQPVVTPRLLLTSDQVDAYRRAARERAVAVPGEVLVKFKAGYAPADQSRALSVLQRGRSPLQTRWVGDALMVQMTAGTDTAAASTLLARQPEVEWAQPNYIRRLSARPTDPEYTRQWNMDLLEMPAAWDINPGATADVTVAVIDSGITTSTFTETFTLWTGARFERVSIPFRVNPDLATARTLPGRDFIFWDGPVVDMVGHGTHVAGTIVQDTNNAVGTAGIAYNARLLPLKACVGFWEIQIAMAAMGQPGSPDPDVGGCTDAAIAQALRYAADQNADVINISLGGDQPAPIIREALRYAVDRGSFVSIAVGNTFEEGNPVEYPAGYAGEIEGVVAVGAVGRSARRASYSNTGSHVDLVAPGGDFGDGGIAGTIFQVSLFDPDFTPGAVSRPRFDRYAATPKQGTSMAAPHVSGAAALLYTQGITVPAAVEAALKMSVEDLGPTGRDNDYGHGLVKPRRALRGMGLLR